MSLRILFLVQGEGRGHLTQALALAPALRAAGHEVVAAVVGASPARVLPGFFADEIGAPVERLDEPGFGYGVSGVRWGQTLASNVRRSPGFVRALSGMDAAFARYRPDVVVSFFSLLGGLYGRLRAPHAGGRPLPFVCVGHQYLFHHPAYPFPPGEPFARGAARAWTALTAPPGARRLALSFYPAPDLPALGLRVVPPLLRPALRSMRVRDDGSLLVYLLHADYAAHVEAWCARHPEQEVHAFWDRADAPETLHVGARLTFHQLSGERFLERMARCHALVCTAGFESVSEAMYAGKPALMVPVAGHFEQSCNARDATAAGAGLYRRTFDLDALLDHARDYRPVPGFRTWADGAADVFVDEIERAAGVAGRARAVAV